MKSTKGLLQEISISYKLAEGQDKKKVVTNSLDAYEQMIKFFDKDTITCQEQIVVMYLNRANNPIGVIPLFKGGLTSSIVDIKLIISIALKSLASGIVVSHNHPSGNLKASSADLLITNKLKDACQLLELSLFDHLIVAPGGNYLSFADEGML